jgi:uncharacterized surface protein with fasciclin (FAS1) repeats
MEKGFDDKYMTTYSNEYGDCGHKYCTVRCVSDGTKYQLCGESGREPTDPVSIYCDPDEPGTTGHEHAGPVGYGCLNREMHSCECEPEVCSKDLCLAQGEENHNWSDNCSSCQCADVENSSKTITDVVCGLDDYSTLCSLVETCPEVLDGDETYTLFAPTDDAFAALNEVIPLDTIVEETVCSILKFHIAEGEAIYSYELNCESGSSTLIEMMNGRDARVKCLNGVPYGIKGGGNEAPANFIAVDIEASNGVIHEVDSVLFFPRVIDSNEGIVPNGITPALRGFEIP